MRTLRVVIAFVALGLIGQTAAQAEGRPFIGIDLGAAESTNGNYRAHTRTGVTINPYAGYMFNRFLGVQGQIHTTLHEPDDDNRGYPRESDTITLFGGTVGPRLSIPIGDLVELYTTAQGGYFTGLSGRLTQSAAGFSLGGGLDFNVWRNISLSAFGRWNRAYMDPRPTDLGPLQRDQQRYGEDIKWATAGVGLKYVFVAPEAPPPPPPPAPEPIEEPAPSPPPIPVKKQIVLRSVNFDFDRATLRADALPVLDEAVAILTEDANTAIVVEGHTDSVGDDQYNLGLSQRRAETVRDYLIQGGIAWERITAQGLGESYPVASNETADGRAQNRRVELDVK